jgi:type I restriction enzyme, S subunit
MEKTMVLNKKNVLAPKLRFKEFDSNWTEYSLNDISLKIQDGTHFSPTSYDQGEFLYLTSKNIKNGYIELSNAQFISKVDHDNIYKRCDVKKGDVILTKDGTIGNVCVNELDEPFSLLSSVAFLRPKPDWDNYFIYQILVSPLGQKEISNSIAGQALKRITLTKINNFKYLFPSLHEQQKIASFLSAVDEKIQYLTRKKELLEQYKKGVMQQMFSGKLRFKDEKGPWRRIVFTECCELIHGFQFREEHFENSGLPVIKIGSLVDNGSISFNNATYVSKKCEQTHSKFILKKGDVLMALTGGTLGKVSKIDKDYGVIFQNYRVGKFENKSNSLKEYIYFLLQSRVVQNRIKSLVNEAAQPNFGKQDFDKIQFSLPSLSEQKKISTFLSSIDGKIEIIASQIIQTQTFKKGLLQQMFV